MADQIKFADEGAFTEAIKNVRKDSNENDWVLFSYEGPKSNTIVLVGTGSGGVNELVNHLQDDIIGYGLVRKTDKIDDSVTVKFAFINWIGENSNRMQKARISTHQGAIRKFIGQFHVDITASSKDEVSDQIITQKIMDTSGSASRVVDKNTGARETSGSSNSASRSASSGPKASGVEFANKEELKGLIGSVRKGDLTWVLFSYENGTNKIYSLAQGNGGADELVASLSDEIVGYGLIRKIEKIDQSETVKFAFIRFVGDNIPRMLRAYLGTHLGVITEFFSPYHVTLDVTQKSEISDDIIMNLINAASGTKVNVLEGKQEQAPVQTSAPRTTVTKSVSSNTTKVPAVPKSAPESAVKFVDKEAVKADIADVRSDATETNWVVVGYEGGKGNTLVTLGKGTGGVAELVEQLADNIAAYALVRKTEKIDESLTVKFAFIIWQGENIDRMHRARLGTHKGSVTELFSPYHTDIIAAHKDELSDDIIMQKISDASGTASKVRTK